MIVVVPPWAAARVPVSNVSEAKVPPKGSSMWVWTSTPPGMTYLPAASIVLVVVADVARPGSNSPTMRSPSTRTSIGSAPVVLMTVPFLMSMAIVVLPLQRVAATSSTAASRMSRPSAASVSVMLSGGVMRSTLPNRPPLPISRPRRRVASSSSAAASGQGAGPYAPARGADRRPGGAGMAELDGHHQPAAPHLDHERVAVGDGSAAGRRTAGPS